MKNFFIIISCCLLAACGFHLRGNMLIPPEIQRIAVLNTANHSQFQQNLEHNLILAGAHIVEPSQADLILSIEKEQIHKMFESVGTNVQLHQYSLQYSVIYQLKNHLNIAIMPMQHVEATRVYRENANQELGSNNEEEVLIGEMQQEVTRNLITRLVAQDTLVALHLSYRNPPHEINRRPIKHAP